MDSQVTFTAALAALVAFTPCAGAQASFQGLGDLPGGAVQSGASGLSTSGMIVGESASSNGIEAYLWTASGGMQGLGDLPGGPTYSLASGVSSNGVVVGASDGPNGTEAYRWTAGGGIVGLGVIATNPVSFESGAHGVSGDGSVVVGFSTNGNGDGEAFRWTAATGMQGLGDLPGGNFRSIAFAVSADGSVIVGAGIGADDGTQAFRWTASGGMVGIGDLAGGSKHSSYAYAVSADGQVVVGRGATDAAGSEAFRWSATSGMVGLGDLPGGDLSSRALGVSGDGSVVVGSSSSQSGPAAFIWTAAGGMRDLKSVLEQDHGLDLTGWTLLEARGISPDGTVIVGQGRNPSGGMEGWRAVLTDECGASLVEAYWISPSGGAFGIGSNWLDGQVPGEGDVAVFELPEGTSYSVSFAGDHQTESTSIQHGNDVRFVLGGHAYSLTGTAGECGPSLHVGNAAEPAALSVQQGSLVALGGLDVGGASGTALAAEAGGLIAAQGGVSLATAAGSHAVVSAREGGQVSLITGNPVVVGGAGDGTLRALAGGTVAVGSPVRVGAQDGGIGLLMADGAGAALSLTEPTDIGHLGLGFLAAFAGGTITTNDLFAGRETGSVGTINVSSAVAQASNLLLGVDGEGFLSVEPGGVLTVAHLLAIPGGAGSGAATVQGTGAVVETGILAVGGTGLGSLTIGPSGFVGAGVSIVEANGRIELLFGCLRVGGVTECGPSAKGDGGALATDTLWISPGAVVEVAAVALGPDGVIGGGGSLPIDLTNAGTINPGDSAGVAGTFTIGGAYTQAPAGALEIELGGTAAGAYDHLAVAGAATLDGVLRFSHLAGFAPAPGDMFDVLTAASVTGAFAGVEGPPGCTYSLSYGPATVTATVLTVAAEPPAGTARVVLHPPAPNPSSGSTTLRYELPAPGPVRLSLFDVLGREVVVLVDGERSAGAQEARIDLGRLSPGHYTARLATLLGGARQRVTVSR